MAALLPLVIFAFARPMLGCRSFGTLASMKFLLASAELRAMFEVANRYAAGASSVHELNGAICNARDMATAADADAAVISLLDDWRRMVNRRWNEWGLEKQPISEEEFQAWLREQLVNPEHAG